MGVGGLVVGIEIEPFGPFASSADVPIVRLVTTGIARGAAVTVALLTALVIVLVGSPATAKTTITITVTLARAQYYEGEEIRPSAKLNGLLQNPAISGNIRFERWTGQGCTGTKSTLSTPPAGAGTIQGPNYNNADLGKHSLRVTYPGDTNYNSANSSCLDYAQQKRSQVKAALSKQTFTSTEEIKPVVTLTGVTGTAGGSVEYKRWTGSNGCAGSAATLGSSAVVNHVVQQSFDHQDGKLGVHEYRASYTGDDNNSAADSPCEAYLVGTHIRGKLFVDTDADGVVDDGETGLATVQVTLKKGDAQVAIVDTSADGSYEFFVTEAATYTVAPNRPAGYRNTTPERIEVQVNGPPVTGRNFGVVKVASSPSVSPSPSESPSATPSAEPSAETSSEPESPSAESEPALTSPAEPGGGLSDVGILGMFCGGVVVIVGGALLVLSLRRRPDRLGDV